MYVANLAYHKLEGEYKKKKLVTSLLRPPIFMDYGRARHYFVIQFMLSDHTLPVRPKFGDPCGREIVGDIEGFPIFVKR